MRWRRLCAAVWLVSAAAGCNAAAPAAAAIEQAIIGGVDSPGDPAVVMLETRDGLCTGSLVAPRVVLTAAHCIMQAAQSGTVTGTVSFGARAGEFVATRRIVDAFVHRRYTLDSYHAFDIGLVRLDTAAPPEIEPLPMNARPLSDALLGAAVRAVGFGVSDGVAQTGAGIKRTALLTISGLSAEHVVVGDGEANTCQGDSGGPILLVMEGVETILGVTSFGEAGCAAPSNKTRVDVYVDAVLDEVVAAWDGPCSADGVCVTEGCGSFPDPDCEPCGFNGVCAEACPRVDLDCPVSGLAGDACADDTGCEERLCVAAPDDARVAFCSLSCAAAADCQPPLTVCGARGVCEFPGATPTTQGAPCGGPADCRSGLCDAEDAICVEPCGEGHPACADGYTCARLDRDTRACRIPDGGCAVAGPARPQSAAGAVIWALGLAGLLALRGRRRACAPLLVEPAQGPRGPRPAFTGSCRASMR